MKTNIPALRLLPAALLAFALTGTTLRADDDEGATASVKLSTPGKPATFNVEVPWADIHITGVDGDSDTITVESTLAQKNAKPTRPGGLRRLDDEVTFELTEHDNTVSLSLAGDNPWAGHDAEFKISMPRAMALKLRTDAGGDLMVKNTDGDIDITSMNGDVVLDGISGSAVVSTMNGEVRASYTKAPQKAVSITSMNGEISLRVPADTKATVSMRNHNGSILTDFGEDVLKTKTENNRHTSSSYSYAYGGSEASREAVRAAMDASRDAVRAAADAAREVAREMKRATKDKDDDDDTPPVPPAVPTPMAVTAPGATPTPAVVAVAPRAPRAPRAPIATITGGKLVTGTLNGGGVDITLSSMNGEITLRQSK